MIYDLSTITPTQRQTWAKGSINSRIEVDEKTVHETITEEPNNLYILERDRKGGKSLKLVGIEVRSEFDKMVAHTTAKLA